MATNVFKGREALLKVGATTAATPVAFGAVRNYSVEVTRPDIEVTNFDSSGWAIRLDGMASWGMNAEAVFLSTGASVNEQDTIRTALSGGTRYFFSLANSTAAGKQDFKGWGYVTGWTWSGAIDGPQLFNLSVAGDGKLTES